ncbi:MAG TPA: DUF5057 domain-containing protein [Paenibacillus sp.]|jgi:choice-of-anchor A domain-containing protein
MKLNKFTFPLTIVGAIILAVSLYLFNVNADQGPIYQIRILEISDDGSDGSSYALHSALAQQENITVDTIPMKQFVAQHDNLNGKYDAIYIGKGTYSTLLMNDITHLKADEIIKEYINKGLPVILHKDVMTQVANKNQPLKNQRVLYDSFYKYSTSADRKANVLFVDDTELGTLISQMKSSHSNILEMLQQRPRIAMDSGNTLIDYSKNTGHSYKVGDKLLFPFQTHHIQSIDNNRIRASLYMSMDQLQNPTENNLVAATNITGPTHEISYTLPKAYSGLLYWRLEVSDQQTGLKDYVTGTIRFKDEKTVVRVLQILPTDDVNSNLTPILEPNLLESDSYKLNIKAVSFDDFNTTYAKQLNGNYDMLVFGFRDEDNEYGTLSQPAATEVQQFIATGQSVMFANDTLYSEPNNSSNTTSLINEGLLTPYPFYLSNDPTTKAYSKGNVTYSSTGDPNTNLSAWEKRLFINTIYHTFMSANHAPEITVNAPTNNSIKPSYLKNLLLSYTVNDWDLKDRTLYTSVKFKHNGTYLAMGYENKSTQAGDTISQSFVNPLPNGGDLQIEISVKDKEGAMATKIINLTIKKATANLETNRTLSTNVVDSKIERGEDVTISYSIKPKDIPVSSDNKDEHAVDQFVISELKYAEKFPANLKVSVSGADTTSSGVPYSGITVKKTFKNITYRLSEVNGIKSYIPDGDQSVNFDIKVSPTVKGVYHLTDSLLEYWDIHSIPKELPLGIANNYSAFMLGDITVRHSGFNMEGRMASSGNILLSSGFGIGTEIPLVDGVLDDVLIANGDLIIENGGQVKGNAVYGDRFESRVFGTIQGTVRKEKPIDFTTSRNQLVTLSSSLDKLTVNGTITVNKYNKNEIFLDGTNQSLNIFNISGTDLNDASGLHVNAPKESTVIINVTGPKLTLANFTITLTGGIQSNHILYNFYEAKTLDILGATVEGSILAPNTTITLNGGNIVGNCIGLSFSSNTAGFGFLNVPFTGTLPSPIPTTPNPPGELTKVVFPDVGFEAIVKVSKLTLEGASILVGEDLSLIPIIEPWDANNQILKWTSDMPEFVTVNNTGEITGIKPTPIGNPAHIKIISTDGSNKSASAAVTVISPNLSILGPIQASVKEQVNLTASYTTLRENITSVVWKIKDANPYATITPVSNDRWNASFQANKTGTYTIVVTIISDKHPNGITAEHQIEVKLEGLSIIGEPTMNLGSKIKLDAILAPKDANDEDFSWTIEGDGSTYAELIATETGKSVELKGKREVNKITVTVTAGGLSASHDVKISSTLNGFQFSNNETTIWIGQSINLNDLLWPIPRSYPLDQIRNQLQWSFDRHAGESSGTETSPILSLDSNGTVTGLKKGYDYIKVTYSKSPTDTSVTATMKIIVVSQAISDDKY